MRLAVLDDNLFVRTYAGEVRPLSSTFSRFVEAIARGGEFSSVRYMVPVRHLRIWEVEPALDSVDESLLELVPTTWFSGISDYLVRGGYVIARNWPIIAREIAQADLLWLRLPASNALLALAAARRHNTPYFGWNAGSVSQVVTAQRRVAPASVLALATGHAYDAVTALAGEGGPLLTLNSNLFASIVTEQEVLETRATTSGRRTSAPWRIAWAGRMAGEKGLDDVVDAIATLVDDGLDVTLVLIGDGPARPALEHRLASLPPDRVEDYGYVGYRPFYMQLLRGADALVHPSRADGVPKVLVDAMAAGVPIVAADVGAVRELLGDGTRGVVVPPGDVAAIVDALRNLVTDAGRASALALAGLDWAATHTAEAQASRLVRWLREQFPHLAWRP